MDWIKLIKAIIISIPLFVQIGIVIGIFNEDDDISNICSVIFSRRNMFTFHRTNNLVYIHFDLINLEQ